MYIAWQPGMRSRDNVTLKNVLLYRKLTVASRKSWLYCFPRLGVGVSVDRSNSEAIRRVEGSIQKLVASVYKAFRG